MSNDRSIKLDYATSKNNRECPLDQKVYTFFQQQVKNVLNYNDNYYNNTLKKLPLMDMYINSDTKWDLGMDYAFYRKTLKCLFDNYKRIDPDYNLLVNKETTYFNSNNFTEINTNKYKNVLFVFISFSENYEFLQNIQTVILISNSLTIFFGLFLSVLKLFSIFCNKFKCNIIHKNEFIITFILDLSTGILGGFSYFKILSYNIWVDNIIGTGCLDSYTQYQFGVFNETLGATKDQNFQLFLLISFKLILVILNTLFYLIYKQCRFKCKGLMIIIKENINEAGYDEIEYNEIDKKIKDFRKKKEKKFLGNLVVNAVRKINQNQNESENKDKDKDQYNTNDIYSNNNINENNQEIKNQEKIDLNKKTEVSSNNYNDKNHNNDNNDSNMIDENSINN
jgi:hypothetical protein